MLAKLPKTLERDHREILLLTALGTQLEQTQGYAAEEVGRAYRQAQALCGPGIGVGEQAAVLLGLWAFILVRAEHAAAREVADELVRQAEGARDTVLILPALLTRGTSLLHMGAPAEALASLQQASDRLDDWHRKRYLVLPGMTGLWQVSGRSELDFDELVRLDFLYLERWSVFLDLTIMLKTIPAVFRTRGAW